MSVMSRILPDAISMIRMDHTHVIAMFHRYRIDAAPTRKRAIARAIGLALEIHARLEEEIFYPAMRRVDPDLVDKSIPEHNDMRRRVAELRTLEPTDPAFDRAVMELMREVMLHVADEETMLLPDAERVLSDQLAELGARMTRRRMELAAPKAGEIAVASARVFPGITLALGGAMALAMFLAGRALARPAARLTHRAPRLLPFRTS
jgi:hypothetical protein